jgi:LmbE family N-acetylglucosaminyl deacetylase
MNSLDTVVFTRTLKPDQDNVLVLSPHTDDGELGAGGTIARFLGEGRNVSYIAFSGCETSVPKGMPRDTLRKECMRSTVALGLQPGKTTILNYEVRKFPENRQAILDDLINIKNRYQPSLVLVPSSHDMHQDHGTIYWEALRAFKKEASIWGYEHPWNNLDFATHIFVRLSEEHVTKKIKALHEYESQYDKGYMDEKNLRALLCTRGSQLDLPYAEAFELVRSIY